MAIIKKFLLILTLVNLQSCDLILGSYFPIGMDMVTSVKDVSDILSEFPVNSTSYYLEEVDNHQGTKLLVMHIAGPGKSKTLAYRTGDLTLVNSFPPDIPTNGGFFNHQIIWDSTGITVGSIKLNWTNFKDMPGGTMVGSGGGKGWFNGTKPFMYSISAPSSTTYLHIDGSEKSMTFVNMYEVQPLDVWADNTYVYLASKGRLSGNNAEAIWISKHDHQAIGTSVSISTSSGGFVSGQITPKDMEQRHSFLTADGLVLLEHENNGSLVRYGFDGSKIDELAFKFDDNILHFSGDGKAWYRLDPYTKKLYRMRTWWSS